MPYFSIIIPLYNKAAYIEKAVESVLGQTYNDFELIVVDDGSTDDGPQRAERFDDPRMMVVRQNNAGVSTARNNGVAQASGDYICFLDADDWWAPNFLEEMDGLIALYPNAGIYGCSYFLVKQGHNKIAPIGIDNKFTHGLINYCRVYANTLCMPLWTGAVSIPRHIFEEQGGFKPHLKLGEDFDLWVRIALQYPVAFLNKPLAYYNQDADISNRATNTHRYQPESFMTFYFDQFADQEATNRDLKILLDKIRVYTLMNFRRHNLYPELVNKEISKVDFSNVPHIYRFYYHSPYWIVHCYCHMLETLSKLKRAVTK